MRHECQESCLGNPGEKYEVMVGGSMDFNNEEFGNFIKVDLKEFVISGKVLKAADLAYKEFLLLSKGRWPLDVYEICISITKNNKFASFSFLPNIADDTCGFPYEIANKGMYKNGMGVVYIFRLDDFSLIGKIFMR